MWGGFTWGGAAWASQPQYGSACGGDGVVFGKDENAATVFGGDTSDDQGIVFGRDTATGIVFGGDR